MAHRRRSSAPYVLIALVGIGAVALGQTQAQDPNQPQLRMRLNGIEVDALQGARGGVILPPQNQPPNIAGSDPLTVPVVKNAPYSGEGVTTVTQTLGDGTRIEQGTTAKFYRDSSGRVRREQTIIGLAPLNPSSDTQTVITIDPDPDDQFAYQLDAQSRTARRVPRGCCAVSLSGTLPGGTVINAQANGTVNWTTGARSGGRGAPPAPVGESLGTRQFEGVRATGTKTTQTIPVGQIGNDRAIEITDERWMSPELQVVVYSRHSDPRSSVIEYKLIGISRSEPADYLFQIPADYTVMEAGGRGGRGTPASVPATPGLRGGGPPAAGTAPAGRSGR